MFQRTIGTDEGGDLIWETVNAAVSSDQETATVDLLEAGRWECDKEELRAALA